MGQDAAHHLRRLGNPGREGVGDMEMAVERVNDSGQAWLSYDERRATVDADLMVGKSAVGSREGPRWARPRAAPHPASVDGAETDT